MKVKRLHRKKKQAREAGGQPNSGLPLAQRQPPIAVSPFTMERTLHDLQRAMEGHQFDSLEEANTFLATLTGKGFGAAPADRKKLTTRDQAQELAYQAMEARSAEETHALCEQALALDPDCMDAIVTLSRVTSQSDEEHMEGLQRAIEAGERSLGADFFRENKGHFWGILETRPYMRARCELADLLRLSGRTGEAIRHFEAMLELNPNDNQGIRDYLLGCYLAVDNLEGTRRLLEEYKGDSSAVFQWGRTLEGYLSGGYEAARRVLRHARSANRHVEAYLSFKKQLPRTLPDSYSFGSEEEAVHCSFCLLEAWGKHPPAVVWLRAGGPSALPDLVE